MTDQQTREGSPSGTIRLFTIKRPGGVFWFDARRGDRKGWTRAAPRATVSDMVPDNFLLRPAVAADAAAVADVWLRSFDAAMPSVRRAHPDHEVRAWIRDVLIPDTEVWVATLGPTVVAMMSVHGGWLEQLYVDPSQCGRGLGGRLVETAKRRSLTGLELWTFAVNTRARRFYERHGFVAVEHTDGAGNEEREPDVRYVWRP